MGKLGIKHCCAYHKVDMNCVFDVLTTQHAHDGMDGLTPEIANLALGIKMPEPDLARLQHVCCMLTVDKATLQNAQLLPTCLI